MSRTLATLILIGMAVVLFWLTGCATKPKRTIPPIAAQTTALRVSAQTAAKTVRKVSEKVAVVAKEERVASVVEVKDWALELQMADAELDELTRKLIRAEGIAETYEKAFEDLSEHADKETKRANRAEAVNKHRTPVIVGAFLLGGLCYFAATVARFSSPYTMALPSALFGFLGLALGAVLLGLLLTAWGLLGWLFKLFI